MAKSFLEAVEEAMPPRESMPAGKPDEDELDENGQPVSDGPEGFTRGDGEEGDLEISYEDLLGIASAASSGEDEKDEKQPVLSDAGDAPDERMASLFEKTFGGGFNPGSKVDQDKMRLIQDMIQEDQSLLELSPAKFAMKVYARK